jgi:adenylyltransferase/sulfurtransferase
VCLQFQTTKVSLLSRVTVVVPPPIRPFVGGKTRVLVEAATVREALGALAAGSGSLHGHLFDENEGLRRFVRVFVNGKPAMIGAGHEQPVTEGAEVTILLALAGG